ncbi:MAG: calcium/sodium antiporter [SAR324 cluster bacterium]|jgi:cation:H+ antiporter|nr:calcium/sodium antiporter [SAR324 cluster bacterium]HCV45641.1 sodium:calcium exchanger [Deltaproteobacteria bacterium]MDP6488617.1 calcium/sodium antiporter [SAR324 cluster bacterium]MDP7171667.1 calcium/sodium antiporter [SAR324 cluster bacterium]MDP7174963.1 calcium/sodium antiporter [SAR324 cluster bacterium]|tara:strand:+ start:649 stop:1605 length:957 start_codon:yes stop_codon:yes gene_type:complete
MPELLLITLYIIGGLVLLFFGADWLVKGAMTLALNLGLSPLIVGLTVVALGTSVPEALVSVQAAIGHQGGIAIGNVVGSNILNIALILGLSALITPLKVDSHLVKADVPLLTGATFMLVVLLEDFHISRMEGTFLLLCIVGYIVGNIMTVKKTTPEEDKIEGMEIPEDPGNNFWRDIALLIVGIITLGFGANFLVTGAVDLARLWGLSEALIGLTIVSIGTGTPELATALMAAYRKSADLAIGNAVGSNLFNIMFVLGLAGLVAPLDAIGINSSDLYVMLAVTILLLPTVWTGRILDRKEGFLFLAIYFGYLYYLWPA